MRYVIVLCEWECRSIHCFRDIQNSSSENKIAVCKRVASAVVPALYARDGTVAGERVKAKIAW